MKLRKREDVMICSPQSRQLEKQKTVYGEGSIFIVSKLEEIFGAETSGGKVGVSGEMVHPRSGAAVECGTNDNSQMG